MVIFFLTVDKRYVIIIIMIIVSACLAGLPTRYDLEIETCPEVIELVRKGVAIPLCPEQLGGLPSPRPASTFEGVDARDILEGKGKILSSLGVDVTDEFLRGAYAVLNIAKLVSAKEAILKEGSPSCGVNYTNRDFKRTKGMGILAYLLNINGISLRSVE